ncbi:hypothetical protein C7999DRAFT_39721 [Corynascus novoguineensis]|uniref:Mitochondrial inner membrane protein 1 n=1 Tax=Corynascus novoguineensis TaxID=1126955 RepID=A0AAN7CVK0_9PEZI|nr:hypothetical protein C7999DRAFT_39721 [Corynascus novoguineensis]
MIANPLRASRALRTIHPLPHARVVTRFAQPSAFFTRHSHPTFHHGIRHNVPKVFRVVMSTKPPLQPNKIDKEFEREVAQKKLEQRPEEVSSSSSVRAVFEASQTSPPDEPDVMEGLKGDINTVKETFALASVPREPFVLGLAGTLPYLVTSLSTVILSWNLNTDWPTKSSFVNAFLFNHEEAAQWLHFLEPIQVGYGAVIISFLGAIHWGLEFAEKQTLEDRARLRYGIGVLAPAVAWPTIFMPIQWALTTQFAAFCVLYYVDSQATVKGWAPPWYASYRFVLTAVVGAAIAISLIGRAKIGEGRTRLSSSELADRIRAKVTPDSNRDWAKEEEKERERIHEEKKQEEKRKKEEEEKAKEEQEKKKKQEKKEGAADTKEEGEEQKGD